MCHVSTALTFDRLLQMGANRFDDLTEQQRYCLRLTAQGFTSKQIGLTVGRHHRAIDQRIDRARRILGIQDRSEAARAFAAFEAGLPTYDRDIRVSRPVASALEQAETSDTTWPEREPQEADVVREAPASTSWIIDTLPGNAPEKEGSDHVLTRHHRLAIIAAVLLVLILAIVATPALLDSFQRVANSIEAPH